MRWLSQEPALAVAELLAGIFWIVLLVELATRIVFPWEMFVWSEAPFMVNQLKLAHGWPLFGPPSDVNSFVYSPGLDYLTFALLNPFGLALDIRWCRLVNVGISVGVALGAALAVCRVVDRCGGERRMARSFWLAFALALLLVHRNLTADVPHPDNLHMLHAIVTLLLCHAALVRRRYALAVFAMIFAGLGVWTKQVEALAVAGAGIALLTGAHWGLRRAAGIVVIGTLVAAIALVLLLHGYYARFYLLDLLLTQGIRWNKAYALARNLGTSRRLLLLVLIVPAVRHMARGGGDSGRYFLRVWVWLGVTAVLPCLVAFMKIMGAWNNLSIIELWLFVLVAPFLLSAAPYGGWYATGRHVALILFLLSVFPVKLPPSPLAYAYGDHLESLVRRDVSAGKRVLLTHGIMPLLRSGRADVPFDRANSALELWMAGYSDVFTPMSERFSQNFYDRIYLNFTFGLWDNVVKAHYHLVETIPGVRPVIPVPFQDDFDVGYTGEMPPIRVYEANDRAGRR